jgi:Reverse transcriptase (RNA-dependent DNA polymerase)
VGIQLVRLVALLLDRRTFQTTWLIAQSSFQPMLAAVPQKAVLSPTIFNMFTADFPVSPHVESHLYADDNAMALSATKPSVAVKSLQRGLGDTERWNLQWRLSLNPTKTTVTILFTGRKRFRQTQPIKLKLRGTSIPWSPASTWG